MSIRRIYPGDIFVYMNDGIKNIAVLGGGGLLAKQLNVCNPNIKLFTKDQVDITKPSSFKLLDTYDIIIHTAALIDNNKVSDNEIDFITTNIIGTSNISNYCIGYDKRLVYISTDYVYDGTGNHSEEDPVNPYNLYAWSKLGGECSVRFVKDHLIIRTSFGKDKFPYEYGYDNLYTSKDYVDVISPLIMNVSINNNIQGVINVGTERKSTYDYAIKRNPNVKSTTLDQEKDFSLNLNKLSYEE